MILEGRGRPVISIPSNMIDTEIRRKNWRELVKNILRKKSIKKNL